MAIAPVNFVVAPPIERIEKLARVKRQSKGEKKLADEHEAAIVAALTPVYPAQSAEELASDDAQAALIDIKFGG